MNTETAQDMGIVFDVLSYEPTSWCELMAILEERPGKKLSLHEASAALHQLVQQGWVKESIEFPSVSSRQQPVHRYRQTVGGLYCRELLDGGGS